MRKRKKIKLNYSKERVLFSDVLPYECPIIFSNRYLYRFLAKYLWVGEEQKIDNITWNVLKQSKRLDQKDVSVFAALLFGCYEKGKRIGKLQHKPNDLFYPYQFNIAHKTNKNRTLSIIHPYNQWQIVEFYEQYKYSVLIRLVSDMKRGKESGNFNINQTIYSTPINLISLTRRIRTEHCQLFIHITSGR